VASPESIAQHVATIAGRSRSENDRLAYAMLDRAWPAGMADFRSTIGSAWLRRWKPLGTHTADVVCNCLVGRCAVCN
jgi:hypothetical protein